MRCTQLLFLAAATAYAASTDSASTDTASVDFDTAPTLEELKDATATAHAYLEAIESVNSKLVAFTTVQGFNALATDYADWTKSYMASASPAANLDEAHANLADQFGGMLELVDKKSYLPKEAQASLVAVVGEYQALLRDGVAAGESTSTGTAAVKTGEGSTKTAAGQGLATETGKPPSNATVPLKSDYTDVNLKDADSAAGRVGGVAALAAVLASGLALVAAL